MQTQPLSAGNLFEFIGLSRGDYIVRAIASLDSRAYKISAAAVPVKLEEFYPVHCQTSYALVRHPYLSFSPSRTNARAHTRAHTPTGWNGVRALMLPARVRTLGKVIVYRFS